MTRAATVIACSMVSTGRLETFRVFFLRVGLGFWGIVGSDILSLWDVSRSKLRMRETWGCQF